MAPSLTTTAFGTVRVAGAARCACAQDALEVRRIVRVHELARARQVQVVEPRQPEAQRRRAQQRRPCLALLGAAAGAPRRTPPAARVPVPGSSAAIGGHAPVVDGDRQVVGEEIGGREAEVDDARHRGRRRRARCRRTGRHGSRPWAACRGRSPSGSGFPRRAARPGRRSRNDAHRARRLAPPRRAAPVGEARAVAFAMRVQPRRARAPTARAVHGLGRRPRARRRRASTSAGGLAVEHREQRAGAIRRRRRHFDARPREMRHQVEIERQLVGGQALVERQHVAAAVGGDEVVGVLDARRRSACNSRSVPTA